MGKTIAQKIIAEHLLSGDIIPGCDEQEAMLAADINKDGAINLTDAAVILDLYVRKAAGI